MGKENIKIDIDKAIEFGLINPDNDSVDIKDPDQSITIYIKEKLTDGDIKNIVEQMDFKIYRKNKLYHLKDMQGGNLASIENDGFESLNSILNRVAVYMRDYAIIVADYEILKEIKLK